MTFDVMGLINKNFFLLFSWLNAAVRLKTVLTRMNKSRKQARKNTTNKRIDEDCSIFTAEARATFNACVIAIKMTPDSVAIVMEHASEI
jgi:hypothetical protein